MTNLDPKYLSFSQAYGYEPLPQLLRLEELSNRARVALWNMICEASKPVALLTGLTFDPLTPVIRSMYTDFFWQPLDLQKKSGDVLMSHVKPTIASRPFNKVFDLLLFFMRHPNCPDHLINNIAETFERHRLAYYVDKTPPVTIYPLGTQEEGEAIVDALTQIRQAGHSAAREHLRLAAECINGQDWAGAAVRASTR